MHRLSRPNSNFLVWLSFPLLLLIVAGFAWRPLAGGDDFWAHASIGRWIIENGRIPHRTLFLWSENIPWIAHAWGTGVLFYGLMRLGGENGGPYLALLLNVVLSATPFVLIWRHWRRNAPFTSLVPPLFVLAMWTGAARYHPRPELFSALFLTLLLLFLIEWPLHKTAPKAQIFGILLMFAIWPNLHGAVALGLVVLYVTVLCDFLQNRAGGRLLALALACTVLVFVCNPRGLEYYRVLIPIGSQTFKRIDEWKPFWVWPALATELVIAEFILWSFGLLLWATNPNRRWAQLGWLLMMGAAFLQARRQLWLTALTALLVVASNARGLQSDELFRGWRRLTKGDVNETIPDPMRLITRVGVLVILVCSAAQAISRDFLPLHATDKRLPVGMAAFLLDKAPPGRLWNDYEYSAYLEWALHDKRMLYIDLNNAYPDSLMDEYFEAFTSTKENDKAKRAELDARRTAILTQRKIDVVAMRPRTSKEGLSILAKYLNENKGWKRIYREKDGTVWARSYLKLRG